MYHGDRSRKETLVEYGFRLPSALDNRPLDFEEFQQKTDKVIYTSATPQEWEIEKSKGKITEQLVRPTGIVDPPVEIRETENQIDDLIEEIRKEVEKEHRILVTTLTKKMSEELTEYLIDVGLRVKYLHSEIDAPERMGLLRGLRLGDFDCLVGINLLREGLDLPEVALVAILDADKTGFLRSETSIIQTAGRAARNINSRVILYAEEETAAIKNALKEIQRRRNIQLEYNKKYNIIPESIKKTREQIMLTTAVAGEKKRKDTEIMKDLEIPEEFSSEIERIEMIEKLKEEMQKSAEELEFERAAKIRDEIRRIIRDQIKERKSSSVNKNGSGRRYR
jgi:excinuclease ABC subunit B